MKVSAANFGLLTIDPANPLVWALVFIAYDLCYYFSHRYGHEWRILWSSHVAHHQSEAFNLSTALRQTSTGWLNGIFYLPLYVLGVPVELMISVGSLNLIYQFWVHTEHVRRIGWLEWILVSPSNHRVHHAKNPIYIDKNYGGVFIVWDRLFGTFQAELENEPCRYGITRQLKSWNPLWANVHVWWDGLQQMRQTPKWSDKLMVWFRSPAWDAPGVQKPSADWQADDFKPNASTAARVIALIQFIFHVPAILLFVAQASAFNAVQTIALAAWLSFGFYTQGLLLEGRSIAAIAETVRICLGITLLLWLSVLTPYASYLGVYLALSLLVLIFVGKQVPENQPQVGPTAKDVG